MGLGHGHVHHPGDVLRLGRRGSEAADSGLRRRAGGQTVSVVVGSGRHLLRGRVRDEALGDGELSMAQLLLHLGVLIGSGQLLVGGGGALCRHHAASCSIWRVRQALRLRGQQDCFWYSDGPGPTCVLRRADAVAVALLVNAAAHSGRWQPPVGAQSVGRNWWVGPVQCPLAGVAVACGWSGFGGAPSGRVWQREGGK